VQRHRTLAAQDGGRVQRDVLDVLAHLAHAVAFQGFDLGDFGAEVGHQAGAGRPGNGGTDLHDLEARQRAGGGSGHARLRAGSWALSERRRTTARPDSSTRWREMAIYVLVSPRSSASRPLRHSAADAWRRSMGARLMYE